MSSLETRSRNGLAAREQVCKDRTTVDTGGTIADGGTIVTPELNNGGLVMPMGSDPRSPGTLAVDGNYEQGRSGVVGIGVAGPQCPQSDKLVITGNAKLNGTLVLTSLNNFHPSSGDTYTILTATRGVKGIFTNVVDTLNTTGLTRVDVYPPKTALSWPTYLRVTAC